MAETIAKRVYDYLELDKVDQKIGAMLHNEFKFNTDHIDMLAKPYLSFSAFLGQFLSIFLHLARLIKHAVLLLGTLLLAAAAALSGDFVVARELGVMAAGRVLLVALNLINTILASVSVLINTLAIPVYKILGIKLKTEEENHYYHSNDESRSLVNIQEDLSGKVMFGFFKSIEPETKSDFNSAQSALNSLSKEFGFSK